MAAPAFELFYEQHKGDVWAFLAKRLGRQPAEDAFQETFLRALRAYDRLAHAENLRGWVLTIASRVIVDGARRVRPEAELTEHAAAAADAVPAWAQLEDLAGDLPPKERAAVVLRYGYDMDYAAIGVALGSSEDAARQAASAGVRRLRGRLA